MKTVLQAEWIKMKSTPFFYLIVVACMIIPFFMFVPLYFDVHNKVDLNRNPWDLHFTGLFAIFAVFIITPLIILMTSISDYVEHQAKSNKYRYCTPITRAQFYFGKALFLVLSTILAFIFLPIIGWISGFIINTFLPEYEYNYYSADLLTRFSFMKRIFIACLGIIGIQYFLGTLFRHFIVPLGIGIMGTVVSFILAALNSPLSTWMPYDYPLIVNDLKMFKNKQNTELLGDVLSKVELLSILVFFTFLCLGWIIERRRNISE